MSDTRSITVMIVEDDLNFRQPVSIYLRHKGFEVVEVGSAEEMQQALTWCTPDLFVLDILLPGEDGFSIAQRYRNQRNTGICIVSGLGGSEERIKGLHSGADFYLTKPVILPELEAALQSILRRLPQAPPSHWQINQQQRLLSSPDGITHPLTESEFQLLIALEKSDGTAVNRNTLYKTLGKKIHGPGDRRVDLQISRLRKKFSDSRFRFPITSVRNVGYLYLSEGARNH